MPDMCSLCQAVWVRSSSILLCNTKQDVYCMLGLLRVFILCGCTDEADVQLESIVSGGW